MKKRFTGFLSLALVLAMLFGVAAVGGVFSLKAQAAEPICSVGDTLTFGSYPQSRVTDAATLVGLVNQSMQSITWKSYNYLSGDGTYASTTAGNWMQYADVTYNGNKYRGVKISQYRPEQTRLQCSAANSLQDDNGYSTDTIYWFKYEPIKWRVLDPSTGLVLSEVCLDAREYSFIKSYNVYYDGSTITAYYDDEGLANRYEHNNQISHWLNDSFLNNGAFSSEERNKILTTRLDLYAFNDIVVTNKIFLLSKEDLANPSHGFSSADNCKARCTDYAAAQGCQIVSGYSPWWVRNATDSSITKGLNAVSIKTDGITDFDDMYRFSRVDSTSIGVRPAMRLNLASILISSVDISSVHLPVLNGTADFSYNIPSNFGYEKAEPRNAAWIETDTKPTSFSDLSSGTHYWVNGGGLAFKQGKYYTFRADLVPSTNRAFISSLKATITEPYGYEFSANVKDNGFYYSIWYCFGQLNQPIYSVDISNVTAPVAGKAASFNYSLPSGANYVKDTPNYAAWIETATKPTSFSDLNSGSYCYWVTGSGFNFKPDKYYTFRADVSANSGYIFSALLSAKINGITANIEPHGSCHTIWYCFGKPGAAAKTLSSIGVTTQPTKKTYNAGESFNKAGMVVKAYYSDGTSAPITSYTVTNGNNLPAGRTSVTISYTEGGVTKTTTVAITVNTAIIPTVAIKNNPGTREIKYGDGIEFTAVVTNLPAGAQIKWYVNGAEKGTGTTFTFSDAKADATITVKIVDGSGNALTDAGGSEISDTETIKVKAGFFQKLISFFKNLFKANRIVTQRIY